MLNTTTIIRRTELRRHRLLMLTGIVLGFALLLAGTTTGLWLHLIPLILVSLTGFPIGMRSRRGYRHVNRVLRMLGA